MWTSLCAGALVAMASSPGAAPHRGIPFRPEPDGDRSSPVAVTSSEAAGLAAATVAARGWRGIQVERVREVITLESAFDEAVAADLMVDHGALPDFDVTDADPGTFAVGYAPEYPSIPPAELGRYRERLMEHMEAGDTVVEVTWSEARVGLFSSYAVVDAAGTCSFDTFGAAFPAEWPGPSSLEAHSPPVALASAASIGNALVRAEPASPALPPSRSWTARGVLGVPQWSASAATSVVCNEDEVEYCGARTSSDSGGTWLAGIWATCETIPASADGGACCVCDVIVGACSGFKTMHISAEDVTFGGVLGFTVKRKTQIGRCCP